ncbi:MAG: methylated-DNA--[protein]-cysteine S-methyltransferase, partial [Myxococcales bacterium]
AADVARPNSVRAVGAAQAANPLPIVIPCHRVVGVGGRLTGYAGGLAAKQWLLEHEAAHNERVQGVAATQRPRRPLVGPVGRPPISPFRA